MKALTILAILLLAGCSGVTREPLPSGEVVGISGNYVRYFHDEEHNVECWFVIETGVSCLREE